MVEPHAWGDFICDGSFPLRGDQEITHPSPTFSTALATRFPIWKLPLVEIVATCTISVSVVMVLMWEARNSRTRSMADWEPQRRSMGCSQQRISSERMARARTVAIVVITYYFMRLLINVLNKAKILRMRCLYKKRQDIPNAKVPRLMVQFATIASSTRKVSK